MCDKNNRGSRKDNVICTDFGRNRVLLLCTAENEDQAFVALEDVIMLNG